MLADTLFKNIFLSWLSHALTSAGTVAVTDGILQGSDVSAGVGAITVLAGLIYSASKNIAMHKYGVQAAPAK